MESALGLMHDLLPPALVEFLNPSGTEWDAPNEGEPFGQPKVPGPDVVDLRKAAPRAAARTTWRAPDPWEDRDAEMAYGSNNWAVAGSHTTHGGALLADDMHLGLGVPNTWYRASLVFETAGGERRVTGVMLPGSGFVVVGSTGLLSEHEATRATVSVAASGAPRRRPKCVMERVPFCLPWSRVLPERNTAAGLTLPCIPTVP